MGPNVPHVSTPAYNGSMHEDQDRMALEQETRPLELSHHEWARAFGVKRAGGTDYRKALQHDPCAYCGEPYRHGESWREIDHIHPRSKDGPNTWSNYTSACGMCNLAKYDDTVLEWLLNLDRLREEVRARLGLAEVPTWDRVDNREKTR